VPKKIFLTYTQDNSEKARAKQLLESGNWGTTLFYKKDRSLRRFLLMKRAFYMYHERFKKYFQKKEG
ncbi:MAG: carboxylate--amine ligase, partial [Enterococcus aquimarinus]